MDNATDAMLVLAENSEQLRRAERAVAGVP
jgi:hypothetical protein